MTRAYNVREIMTRAWAIWREASDEAMRAVFAECLRMAWAEAEAANATVNADAVADEWAGMSGLEQVRTLRACIRKAAAIQIGWSKGNAWTDTLEATAWGNWDTDDLEDLIPETWIRAAGVLGDRDRLAELNRTQAARARRPLSLAAVVVRAARAAIEAQDYQMRKHGIVEQLELPGADGSTVSMLDLIAAPVDVEDGATLRATVLKFAAGRDAVDRVIMDMLPSGYTEREIGKACGMSGPAIHKRIVRLRASLQDALKEAG